MLAPHANRLLFLVIAGAISACACAERKEPQASQDTVVTNPDGTNGSHTAKPSAPVTIKATLSEGNAAIELSFDADASNVSVDVWGTGGLVVTSAATPIQGRAFSRGEKMPLAIAFTAPETRSDLAVRVRGTFGGKERDVVRSFSLHAEAQAPNGTSGEVRVGPDGQPVRVMKAE